MQQKKLSSIKKRSTANVLLEEPKVKNPEILEDMARPVIEFKVFSRDLWGLIFVADDQHINLEIIKQHMSSL